VAFEELTSTQVDAKGQDTPDATSDNPNKIAEHKDINDADQTVTSELTPKISTNADFAEGSHEVVAGAKIVDEVSYEGLVPGKEYTLKAELISKKDEKTVLGTGEATFTPEKSAGKESVTITVNDDVTEPVLAAVAFEELTSTQVDAKGQDTPDATSDNPNKIAEHKDINDADQTVTSKKDETPNKDHKPSETSTPMTSTSSSKPSASETKSSEPKKETTSESEPSESPSSETSKKPRPTKVQGQEPSEPETSSSKASATMKPSTTTSSEKSKEPRPTKVQGQEPSESPVMPKITTDADFAEGSHAVVAGAKIVDEVSYEGLVPGKEYTLKAELINKKDGKTVLGTGEKTFTPEKSAGKVDVEITVNADVTEPVEAAVAFEELTSTQVNAKGEETPDATPENPNHIAEHKDINDDDQTVVSKKDEQSPSKKDEKPKPNPEDKTDGRDERPGATVKDKDAPAKTDRGTGKVEQHVEINNHVPGKTGKPLPSDAKRTKIKSVPSGATELEPGMQYYIK
ncbi:VaFE repeat-containing surface-anchored protein, partial [Corynebacterium macginleyi]|uniref:VaFE repeat-containing surface-anchored protein n=1 Tax=Corynebacterium macginleyi TaxID=38290 RepID=UPI00190988EF